MYEYKYDLFTDYFTGEKRQVHVHALILVHVYTEYN